MELLHDNLIQLFFSLSPFLRNVFIFFLAFGEGLPVIGSFLPGGTMAILIGSLSVEGFINPWIAVNLLAIGSLCGDLIGFIFGRYLLHIKYIQKIVYHEKHQKKWDLFDRHAALVIIFGKVVPVIRSMPSLFAGARKMNLLKYILYVLIGSYIWAVIGIFGGKYLGQLFGDFAIIFIIGILIITAVYSLYANRKNKKIQPRNDDQA